MFASPTGSGSGSGSGSGPGRLSSRCIRSLITFTGLRVNGAGSSHRSRKVASMSATAGSTHGQLHVMPRRTPSVDRRHRLPLPITGVITVVAPAVAQVDTTDERDVEVRAARMTQHDELLMMGTARPDPHVEQALTAGSHDVLAEMAILLLAERELVQVRAPHQPLHHDASGRRGAQRAGDLDSFLVEDLVGIAAPIGEQHQIAGAGTGNAPGELREVHLAVNKRHHRVAGRPGRAVRVTAIEAGRGVTAFVSCQEPLADVHDNIQPHLDFVARTRHPDRQPRELR